MGSLAEFSRRINAFKKTIEEETEALIGRVLLAIQDSVVIATPIDTSRARSNWIPTIGTPAVAEVSFVMGAQGSTASEAYQRAMAAAQDVASKVKTGNKVWITNNVPYIRELNRGTSTQQAALFVERAVEVGRDTK